ncbi:hypothetical protein MUK42_03121 [Musa troglodytarum]|uniref:Uncharacterized protein n=1 Tax=Musa troglodytarum TaxID=320322 RepID=A0A9E7G324_9LILI|nr:hypothetical protein MUK42_03121 [Musa troglodytarum]
MVLWETEDEEEGAGWRCRKHTFTSQPRYGVCSGCLRDRLLRLCPHCANERPCGCFLPSSSSSSTPSSSRGSVGGSGGIGAEGVVSRLIEREPAFRRSRSVGFQLTRETRPVACYVDGGGAPPRPKGGRRWASFWPFSRATAAAAELSRSRSVGAAGLAGSGGEEERGKGWRWRFPSPMNPFRHRRSTNVVH